MDEYWDIGSAWYGVCNSIIQNGREYTIDRGSYVGVKRKQLDFLAFRIIHPENRPLGIVYNGMPVSDDASIEAYFKNYLLTGQLSRNEQYTYGERIAAYLPTIAKMLLETPNTNQATLEVGKPDDIELPDPPCLRLLSWKMAYGKINMSFFFRSWDAFVALPTNLGGLQLLNELLAGTIGAPSGELIAYSDGAHIYSHNWGMV